MKASLGIERGERIDNLRGSPPVDSLRLTDPHVVLTSVRQPGAGRGGVEGGGG
jgi:hypothetical protein